MAWRRVVQTDVYRHTVHAPFTNGAMEYGFVRKFLDPFFMLTGTGYIPKRPWFAEQPPQVYASLAVPTSWIGGYPAGSPQWQAELFNSDYTPATGDYTTSYD